MHSTVPTFRMFSDFEKVLIRTPSLPNHYSTASMMFVGQKNRREVVLKHVSEAVECIQILWEHFISLLRKSIFEDFPTPDFPGIGKF